MKPVLVANCAAALAKSWVARDSVNRTLTAVIYRGVRHALDEEGYTDDRIGAFLMAARDGTLDWTILEPMPVPVASLAQAQLDSERRDRQRREHLADRELQKTLRAAARMMRPVRQLFDEYAQLRVRLPACHVNLDRREEAILHLPRPFPDGDGYGRTDVRFSDAELVLRMDDNTDLILRIVRGNSAFVPGPPGRAGHDLYYYGFLCLDGKPRDGTQMSTLDFADVISWFAAHVAAFEYQPPNVLGDAPLEETDGGARSRVIELDK